MKLTLAVLLLSTALISQSPCPLQVVQAGAYGERWPDNGGPQRMRVEATNSGDKEIDAAVYRITYRDLLGKVTDTGLTEPDKVHESGHKTLRPGKKAVNFFKWDITHPHDTITVEAVLVRFADGTTWEEPKK